MNTMNRRQFLGYGGLLAASLAVAGCSGGSGGSGGSGSAAASNGTLSWWDPRLNVQKQEKQVFDSFAKSKGGIPVRYRLWDPAKMGQALQLAFQSHQMPDVFTPQNVNSPPSQLLQAGWFAPIDLDPAVKAALPAGNLIEGVNVFDGKVYGVPFTASGTTNGFLWFNKDIVKKAGIDPDNPPATYDEMRSAARKITGLGGGTYGWLLPTGEAGALSNWVINLAAAAGSPTAGGVDLRTGEYAYDNDYHTAVLEWWLAMKKDGSLFPGGTSMDGRTARVRFATGVAGFFFDAQFFIGVVHSSIPQFISKVGLGYSPVPEAGQQITMAQGPVAAGTNMWISKNSPHVAEASRLISLFTNKTNQALFSEGMNAPPLYPDALSSKVDPLFAKAIDWEAKHIFLAPIPVVRNPDVSKVQAAMKPVTPDLGDIVAGAMSGDVTDYRGALKKLTDASEKARETAITAASKKGAKVSVDDWKFPDWKPGVDYVTKPGGK